MNFLTHFILHLKKLYSRIYWFFIHSSKNRIDGFENWENLLDLIPNDKKSKLYSNLNISINILSILQHFTRITWELFKINLIPWPKNKESQQPFCCLNDESEVVNYRKSVLADFRLFVSTPFILYVEGDTEKNIIESYFRTKGLWFPISVENIKGIDKTIQILTINKPIKERNYYFFLDYENSQKYKRNKSLISDHGNFFFPDFISENFEPEIILDKFNDWVNNIGGILKSEDIEFLDNKLKTCKSESNTLIQMKQKKGNPEGYEKVLINFSLRKYNNLLIKLYPNLKVNGNPNYISKAKFEQEFRKIFTEKYIISIIENSLKSDPKRKGKKYPFEVKPSPFYNSINQYIHRNDIIRYDLKI